MNPNWVYIRLGGPKYFPLFFFRFLLPVFFVFAAVPGINATELSLFRRMRFNKIQRHYENVWLWRDINIGPHGRYIFQIPVPHKPVHWMITAFSMSQSYGFGMIQKPIEVNNV